MGVPLGLCKCRFYKTLTVLTSVLSKGQRRVLLGSNECRTKALSNLCSWAVKFLNNTTRNHYWESDAFKNMYLK